MHDVLPDIWRAKLARPWPSYASPLDVRVLVFRKNEIAAYGGRRILADPDPATDPLGLQEGVHSRVLRAQVIISSSNPANPTNFITMIYLIVAPIGDVIPLFLKQRPTGRVTVTDPRMTRFWITLRQGVAFVLMALECMLGGEMFIPKLPTMNIGDLAAAICPECEVKVVGIRPGEKLHEVLIPRDEARNTVEFPDYYIIKSAMDLSSFDKYGPGGRKANEDFEYISSNRDWLLGRQELSAILSEFIEQKPQAKDGGC